MTSKDQAALTVLIAESTTAAAAMFGELVESAVIVDYAEQPDDLLSRASAAYLGPGAGLGAALRSLCARMTTDGDLTVVVALGDGAEVREELDRNPSLVITQSTILPGGRGVALSLGIGHRAQAAGPVLDVLCALTVPTPVARPSRLPGPARVPAQPSPGATWRRRASRLARLTGVRSKGRLIAVLVGAVSLAAVLVALLVLSVTSSLGIGAVATAVALVVLLAQALTVRLVLTSTAPEDPRLGRSVQLSRDTRKLLDRRTRQILDRTHVLEQSTKDLARLEPYLHALAAEQSRLRAGLEGSSRAPGAADRDRSTT